MAVAVTMDFPGGTLEQYDEVIGKMGLAPEGSGPPGALFHWVTLTPTGLKVTDVWESRQQFDDFARDQIGPFTAEVGIPGPPEMTFHEVHNYFTSGS
jgi:hypothetical protein